MENIQYILLYNDNFLIEVHLACEQRNETLSLKPLNYNDSHKNVISNIQ